MGLLTSFKPQNCRSEIAEIWFRTGSPSLACHLFLEIVYWYTDTLFIFMDLCLFSCTGAEMSKDVLDLSWLSFTVFCFFFFFTLQWCESNLESLVTIL